MGFSHEKTTHHFLLSPDGGVIEVTVNEAADKASAEAIRSHLSHIVVMFGAGDFSAPMFIHDGIPPGVTRMETGECVDCISKYKELPAGGRVRIQSKDPIAVSAIHDFLRFQIVEHHAGDSLATN